MFFLADDRNVLIVLVIINDNESICDRVISQLVTISDAQCVKPELHKIQPV